MLFLLKNYITYIYWVYGSIAIKLLDAKPDNVILIEDRIIFQLLPLFQTL